MSVAEFGRWVKYRNKFGAMDDRRVYDQPAALVASVVAQIHGGKAKPEDFMPKIKDDDPVISDPRQLLSVFGAFKR